jgi:hypothetical protein
MTAEELDGMPSNGASPRANAGGTGGYATPGNVALVMMRDVWPLMDHREDGRHYATQAAADKLRAAFEAAGYACTVGVDSEGRFDVQGMPVLPVAATQLREDS